MAYEIRYHSECLKKDIGKIDKPLLRRIRHVIESKLASSPSDFGKPLRHTTEGLWSLRVGDWRVIYKIDGQEVWVLRIGHRREVYSFL